MVVALAVALGGCAGLGLPFGETAANRDITTGSIQKVSAKSGGKVDQSDWETVRKTIAGVLADGRRSGEADWRNPGTGSTGTVAVLNTVTSTNDENCRNFETTMNDTRGIRRYRGEACKMSNGRWQLFGVMADDSQLL